MLQRIVIKLSTIDRFPSAGPVLKLWFAIYSRLASYDQLSQQVRSSSDVWSFGVVVWEILTLGSLPYGELSHQQIIINVSHLTLSSFA